MNLLWNVYIFYIAGKCITRSNLTIIQTGKIEIDTQLGEFQELGFNKRDHRPDFTIQHDCSKFKCVCVSQTMLCPEENIFWIYCPVLNKYN